MRALAAHLGIKDQLTELPPNKMDLNDKKDFIVLFDKIIEDMNVLNQKKLADRYKSIMDMLLNFMNKKER